MAAYEIEWRPSTRRDLRRIPPEMIRRIVQAVENLSSNPHPSGAVKLSGSDSAWRIRVSDYRIIYQIENARLVIEVIKIGHRRDIYR
jgi:mRNA interferase RelE/StbE